MREEQLWENPRVAVLWKLTLGNRRGGIAGLSAHPADLCPLIAATSSAFSSFFFSS